MPMDQDLIRWLVAVSSRNRHPARPAHLASKEGKADDMRPHEVFQ
jgi:hypothetical protein